MKYYGNLYLYFVALSLCDSYTLIDGPFISKEKAKERLKEIGQPEHSWDGRHCVIKSELDSRMTQELESYE